MSNEDKLGCILFLKNFFIRKRRYDICLVLREIELDISSEFLEDETEEFIINYEKSLYLLEILDKYIKTTDSYIKKITSDYINVILMNNRNNQIDKILK